MREYVRILFLGVSLAVATMAPAAAAATPLGLEVMASGSPGDGSSAKADSVAALAPLQLDLRTRFASTFGGLWVDASGVPTIGVVEEDAATAADVSNFNLPIPAVIKPVTYSEAALNDLHSKIVTDAGDEFSLSGVQLAAVETDVLDNRVNVEAVGATVEQLDGIESAFGPAVLATSVAARTQGNACTKANCPNPLKGGLRLYQHSTFWCMSGFELYFTTHYYLTTAGHCSTVGNVYQHPSGTNIGTVSGQGWRDNSPADASIFPIAAAQQSNQYLVNNTGYILRVTSVEDPSMGQEVIGEDACVNAQTSATCGILISNNNTISICEGACHTILQMRRASFPTIGGDSGSPVTVAGKAQGIVSASYPGHPSDSLYSHEKNVENYFLLQTRITP
jgi:hypothetical protein